MSDKNKNLEDILTVSQRNVETLFDTLKGKESRELNRLEKSLEYWSIGKGREMLDYISERYNLGLGNKEDLEVCLSDNLRFNVADVCIGYSSCGFERDAKGDLFYNLTDADSPDRAEGDSYSFVISEFDPETSTGTSYRSLANLLTLIVDEGLTASEFNNKMNEHVITILGGKYPPDQGTAKKEYVRLLEKLDYKFDAENFNINDLNNSNDF